MFLDIAYLKDGNDKQKKVYALLTASRLMETLEAFKPILVGTIPIGIDIAGSDLDILLEAEDFDYCEQMIAANFGHKANYQVFKNSTLYRVINFQMDSFEVELYMENRATILQNGYRHMVIEHRLLQLGGEGLRRVIIQLKEQGYKTEPAFGHALGLGTDPYKQLLDMYDWQDHQLMALLTQNNFNRQSLTQSPIQL